MTVISFIGFGEAGGLLAKGLAGAGAEVRAAYDILIDDPAKSAALRAKAAALEIGAAATHGAAVAGADVVISAVVSAQALAAARASAPHLRPGQFYLDINSASPEVKREVARVIEGSGADFVEAAVMELVPPHGHKVPMLLAGPRAAALADLLAPFGMNVRAIGADVGDASAVKMIRSVFMKGFTAILLECLVAAHKLNAEDEILDSLQTSFPGLDWRRIADYYAARLVKHARRQADEMDEVCETLAGLGVEPVTAAASARRLRWLAGFGLAEAFPDPPENFRELLEMLRQAEAAGAAAEPSGGPGGLPRGADFSI